MPGDQHINTHQTINIQERRLRKTTWRDRKRENEAAKEEIRGFVCGHVLLVKGKGA